MMYLAKIIRGQAPTITEVNPYEWTVESVRGTETVVKRPRRAWARKTKTGAAALSQTPAGAIASAKVVLEEQLLALKGADKPCKPKYQRAHIA